MMKWPSTPPDYEDGVVDGVSTLARQQGAAIDELVHGTTLATNAVLERRGAVTALITTAGFRDVLELRRLRMPHMYDLFWKKPTPLVPRRLRFEVSERVLADGTVETPVDREECVSLARRLKELGVESVGIALIHSHRYPEHERAVRDAVLTEFEPEQVSISSDILREEGEYERTVTTVVNSYVRPLMSRYLDAIQRGIRGEDGRGRLALMQSSGGLMSADDARRRPVFALESGPAAGVVAALALADELKLGDALAFDMGGTTAKASLIQDGEVQRGTEYEVGGEISIGSRLIRGSGELLRIPNIDIAEVGAGGGSIAWLDNAGGLQVGPRSAGARPGPACYGHGGTDPTVTDANVLLGYIAAGAIADATVSISKELAEKAFQPLAEALNMDTLSMAAGVHDLANARMMRPLRAVSSERGKDPRGLTLIAYGGSGPVHAANLAQAMKIKRVVIPPMAGVFSAVGLLRARPEYYEVRPYLSDVRSLDAAEVQRVFSEMEASVAAEAGSPIAEWRRTVDVRYVGQSWEVEVIWPESKTGPDLLSELIDVFERTHAELYGVRGEQGAPVEIRTLRVVGFGRVPQSSWEYADADANADAVDGNVEVRHECAHFGAGKFDALVLRRPEVPTDQLVRGPALVREYDTTVVVPPNWSVRRDPVTSALILDRSSLTQESRTA